MDINEAKLMLFCDICGDNVKVVYPCKFIFHDGVAVDINICLECYNSPSSKLVIDISRKRLIGRILNKLNDLKRK